MKKKRFAEIKTFIEQKKLKKAEAFLEEYPKEFYPEEYSYLLQLVGAEYLCYAQVSHDSEFFKAKKCFEESNNYAPNRPAYVGLEQLYEIAGNTQAAAECHDNAYKLSQNPTPVSRSYAVGQISIKDQKAENTDNLSISHSITAEEPESESCMKDEEKTLEVVSKIVASKEFRKNKFIKGKRIGLYKRGISKKQ